MIFLNITRRLETFVKKMGGTRTNDIERQETNDIHLEQVQNNYLQVNLLDNFRQHNMHKLTGNLAQATDKRIIMKKKVNKLIMRE